MKEIKFIINYGGYVGTDDEYYVEVDDDATEDEIEDAISEKYEELIHDNCYWERCEDEE